MRSEGERSSDRTDVRVPVRRRAPALTVVGDRARRTSVKSIGYAISAVFAGCSVLAAQAQKPVEGGETARPQPLPIAAALRALTLPVRNGIALSSDGRWIALTVQRPGGNGLVNMTAPFTNTGVPPEFVGSRVRVVNARTGATVEVTRGEGTAWGPAWAPDNRHLAFYSDRDGTLGVWLWDRVTGHLRRLSKAVVRVGSRRQERLTWTPDGKRILTKVLPRGMSLAAALRRASVTSAAPARDANRARSASVQVLRYDPTDRPGAELAERQSEEPALVRALYAQLALIDVATGRITRITRPANIADFSLSPDGRFAAYVVSHAGPWPADITRTRSSLFVVSLSGGPPRAVSTDITSWIGRSVAWSPDGRRLSYVMGTDSLVKAGEFIGVVDREGDAQQTVRCTSSWRLDEYDQLPLWDASGKSLYVAADGHVWRVAIGIPGAPPRCDLLRTPGRVVVDLAGSRATGGGWSRYGGDSLLVVANVPRDGKMGFLLLDGERGGMRILEEAPMNIGPTVAGPAPRYGVTVSADSTVLAYTAETARTGPAVWIVSTSFQNARQITTINPELLRFRAGRQELVEYRGERGDTLRGTLLLPAAYEAGRRYPLLVYVYPGDRGVRHVNTYGLISSGLYNMQVFATRGYAVFAVDLPQPPADHWVAYIAHTVSAAVDRLIEMGIADPDRLGIMGASAGGYATLATITQTDRFKAAVIHAGFGDWASVFWGPLGPHGEAPFLGPPFVHAMLQATPWSDPERYLRNSPLYFLDHVTTPILLTHGVQDSDVPLSQGDAIFTALRFLGRRVEYVRYVGEDHVIRSFANQTDYWQRRLAWFDHYLKR